MLSETWLHLIAFVSIISTCHQDDNVTTLASRRKYLEEQALSTYRSACVQLQNTANWVSVLLKLKSALTNATTNSILADPNLDIDISSRHIPIIPERPRPDTSDCASLRNFRVTLQTYLHFQALLLQLKGILGSVVLQSGKSKLDNTSNMLKDRIGDLDILNRTLYEIFEKLKESNQFMSALDNVETFNILSIIKDIQKRPNLFENIQEQASSIFRQIQEVNKNAQNLKLTRSLFQTGSFFQNVGVALDNFFALYI